jgi:hypothetical protein
MVVANKACIEFSDRFHLMFLLQSPKYPAHLGWCITLGQANNIIFCRSLEMKTKQFEGGCICGSIRFRVTGEPGKPHTCSCESCRKHSGSLTLTWVEFSAQNVEWVGPGGKPSIWRSSSYSSRAFCSTCGSTIGAIDDEPTIALVTGVFDKPHLKDFAPTYHSYVSRRPRWWHVKSDHECSG